MESYGIAFTAKHGKTYTFTPISQAVHATSREGVPPGSPGNLLEGPRTSPPVHEYRPQDTMDTSGNHLDLCSCLEILVKLSTLHGYNHSI